MALIRLNDRLTKLLMILGATWAFVLCFIALADIIFRAINMPLHGTKEIVANSVVMIVFLQVGFAVRSRSMLSADFLIHMFGPSPPCVPLPMANLMAKDLSGFRSGQPASRF